MQWFGTLYLACIKCSALPPCFSKTHPNNTVPRGLCHLVFKAISGCFHGGSFLVSSNNNTLTTTTATATTTTVTIPWFLACGAPKASKFAVFFLPQRTLQIGLAKTKWRFAGAPCAHHRHHQQPNDSKHLSLDSFASLFFAIMLWRRILHRYASTTRRPYAQKPLHRATFMRKYSYTERFVHR